MKIYLFNTLTRKIEEFKPAQNDEVRMYSCGPTVYNFAHIGNMRAFLFADLLQRVLRVVGGYQLKWVMNITDIDDKTIRDSKKGSTNWLPEMGIQSDSELENLNNFTDVYFNYFIEDISKLGINIEDFYALPFATDFIEEMQILIKKIYDNGYAYVNDGSVYFNVAKWSRDDKYGKLFKVDLDNFKIGDRVDSDEYEKENVSDFVLWKKKKEGEPFWEFEINGEQCPGRPGWHIECSAMEYELLDLPFDIHTGGVDLRFPHHEDEIAQSKAGYGCEPTNYWLHNEFLEVEGQKMSKSLGNFYTIRDLINKGLDPIDIRFAMLSTHYRTKYNFTFAGIESSKKARLRIQDFIYELLDNNYGDQDINSEDIKKSIFKELANDLHTPKALAAIFTLINNYKAINLSIKSKSELIELLNQINNIFEAWEFIAKPLDNMEMSDEIIDLAEKRWSAKMNKNFEEADKYRKLLEDRGYSIKDTKDNYTIEKRND